jgi:hypothetical protein
MPGPQIFTGRLRRVAHARVMDLISLALGIGCFAAFLALIEGLKRV